MTWEVELCPKWGEGKDRCVRHYDRCVRHYDHEGECVDARGRTESDKRRELGMKPKESK